MVEGGFLVEVVFLTESFFVFLIWGCFYSICTWIGRDRWWRMVFWSRLSFWESFFCIFDLGLFFIQFALGEEEIDG